MVACIYMGGIITLPVTGIISGCLMGIFIHSPRWGYAGQEIAGAADPKRSDGVELDNIAAAAGHSTEVDEGGR
ncbi:Na+/Pi symporter [Elasticomyces elasticus]|uniref:Na+/Pi symporter n=1 Tax=Elasticomyces elasticus TaxID=574655 RepID=A0AAN7ZWS3_9PEZI|nr:Na+/Pi symporter [Elasticomyces elasticus]